MKKYKRRKKLRVSEKMKQRLKANKEENNKHEHEETIVSDDILDAPILTGEEPTITIKDNVYANGEDIQASSMIITNNDGRYNLLDRSTFMKQVYKNTGYGVSAQVKNKDYGMEWQTPLLNPDYIASMLNLSWSHKRCCEVVARDVTRNGVEVITRQNYDDEEYKQGKLELQDWITDSYIPFTEELSKVAYDYEALGNAGLELIREAGYGTPLLRFEHLNTLNCKISVDGRRVKQTIASKTVYFQVYNENYDEDGKIQYLDRYSGKWSYTPLPPERQANEVIWYNNYESGSNQTGVAPITTGIDIIKLDCGALYFNTAFFENYGMAAFAVKISGNFKDEEKNRYLPDGSPNPNFDITKTLRYQIGQQIQEVHRNPHSAIVLSFPTKVGQEPVSVDILPLSTDVKEASFRLMREDNLKAICGCHGMSKNLISTVDTGALGGNALDTEISNHSETKIQPLQEALITPINKVLQFEVGITFSDQVGAWKINLPNLLKIDVDKEIDRTLKAVDYAILSPYDAQVKLSKVLNIVPDEENTLLKEYFFKGHPLRDYFYSPAFDEEDMQLSELQSKILGGEADIQITDNRRRRRIDNITSVKSKAGQRSKKDRQTIYKFNRNE